MKPKITNRFRIAVAIAALSCKPPHQSLTSYVVDLKTRFAPDSRVEVDLWRRRSFALEEELRSTVEAFQREITELDVRRIADALHQDQVDERDTRPRKKRKVHQGQEELVTAPTFIVDWNAAMKDLNPGQAITCRLSLTHYDLVALISPSLSGDLEILNTMAKLGQVVLKERSKQHLLPLIKRCVVSCGTMLSHILQTNDLPSRHSLTALGILVPALIAQALSLLPTESSSAEIVDVFIRTTYEQIFRPIIQNIFTISTYRASIQLKRNTGQLGKHPPSMDKRPVILGICLSTLDSMAPAPYIQLSMSLTLAHACARSLQKEQSRLPTTISDSSIAPSGSTTEQCVQRLAFRDAFWYILSILRAAFSLASKDSDTGTLRSPLQTAMRQEVLHDLAVMLQAGEDGSHGIGLVERSMLVGILEMVWTAGWMQVSKGDTEESFEGSHD